MPFDLEETIELIHMHGRTIIDDCICESCHGPLRDEMLKKVERMRELILTMPEHSDEELQAERRMAH